jgi:hypothetical protein
MHADSPVHDQFINTVKPLSIISEGTMGDTKTKDALNV